MIEYKPFWFLEFKLKTDKFLFFFIPLINYDKYRLHKFNDLFKWISNNRWMRIMLVYSRRLATFQSINFLSSPIPFINYDKSRLIKRWFSKNFVDGPDGSSIGILEGTVDDSVTLNEIERSVGIDSRVWSIIHIYRYIYICIYFSVKV